MSLIGQPESYSDMLKRIFAATLTVSVLCTFALAAVSPAVRTVLESWSTEVSIGILDGVKALYVLIPLGLAILCRIYLLHDKISDILGIRNLFDLGNILQPLAAGVGFPITGESWKRIEESRDLAMTRTFYRYASFKDPKIDVQMVRTAADRWAWFWCAVEPQIVLVVTGFIFGIVGARSQIAYILVSMLVLNVIAFSLWPQLRKGASRQVAEILDNNSWKVEIRAAFSEIAEDKVPSTDAANTIGDDIATLNSNTASVSSADDPDVFICHASEDKEEFVRPLAEGLQTRGISVWFDEFTLTVGDSLRRSIDQGLARSRYGVVVISPNFLRKEWPQKELDGLVAREVDGTKVILPVWYNITAEKVQSYSPLLADRLAASSSKGLDQVIDDLMKAISAGNRTAQSVRPPTLEPNSPTEVGGTPSRTGRVAQSAFDFRSLGPGDQGPVFDGPDGMPTLCARCGRIAVYGSKCALCGYMQEV